MGAYDQALPLYRRALKIREKVLGPEHPDTATSLNNLAMLYQAMGAYEQALPLYQRTLKIIEKVLRPGAPPYRRQPSTIWGLCTWPGKTIRPRRPISGGADPPVAWWSSTWPRAQPEEALKLLAGPAPHLAGFARQTGAVLYPAGPGPGGGGAAGRGGPGPAAGGGRGGGPAPPGAGRTGRLLPGRHLWRLCPALPGAGERPGGDVLKTGGPAAGPEGVRPRTRGRRPFTLPKATKGRVLLEAMAAGARQETRTEIPAELRQQEESLLNRLAALEAQWEKALKGGEAALKEVQEKKARLTGGAQGPDPGTAPALSALCRPPLSPAPARRRTCP